MINIKNILKLTYYKVIGKNRNTLEFQKLAKEIHEETLQMRSIGAGSFIHKNGEKNLFRHLTIPKNAIIFDLGANKGDFIEMIQEQLSFQDLHAFEPVQNVYGQLQEKFDTIPNVHLVNKGIGSSIGKMTIYSDPNNDLLSSLYDRDLVNTAFELSEKSEVEITTIDAYCAEKNIPQIHFLKIDIEGHEIEALKGAKTFIEQGKIQFIQFEFGGCNIDSKTYLRDFFDLLGEKYVINRILEDGLYPFSYSVKEEVFDTTNYLAVLK